MDYLIFDLLILYNVLIDLSNVETLFHSQDNVFWCFKETPGSFP